MLFQDLYVKMAHQDSLTAQEIMYGEFSQEFLWHGSLMKKTLSKIYLQSVH